MALYKENVDYSNSQDQPPSMADYWLAALSSVQGMAAQTDAAARYLAQVTGRDELASYYKNEEWLQNDAKRTTLEGMSPTAIDGDRINAEDVNVAAGEHDRAKRDELRRDTQEERDENALNSIRDFCVDNNVNCFLVEQEADGGGQLLGELVDLRFVHVVRARTTVRDKPGKLYTAYMLDISQYTGERLRRDLEMIHFWRSAELDKIRRSKYVLAPDRLAL